MMNHYTVMIDIKAMLERTKAPVTSECCIYRVPSDIRGVKEDAYTPKIVSIGPFHHNGHPGLKNRERQKLSYCNSFLERTQTSLDSWIRYIEDVEPNFHNCYSDTLEFSKEDLTKIIFVDSAFIFELLSYNCDSMESLKDSWFLSKPSLHYTVRKDLLLLENQLPFFVLEHLFNLSFPSRSDGIPSLLELTFRYFGYYNKSNLSVNDIVGIRHFTDLIRTFHLQHPMQKRPPRTQTQSIMYLPSATELSEAGVIFKVKTQSSSLLDLTFSGKIFEIPQLEVYDETELLFRNIVALEQCHYPLESYITDYFHVLDFLVNTGKDVDILIHKGIPVNRLGDTDTVANHFNGILKNNPILESNYQYFCLCQNLNAFYKNRWNQLKSTLKRDLKRMKRDLKRDYCGSFWQTAASIAAIILLIMSFVQTVCSILQVKQQ